MYFKKRNSKKSVKKGYGLSENVEAAGGLSRGSVGDETEARGEGSEEHQASDAVLENENLLLKPEIRKLTVVSFEATSIAAAVPME